MNYRLKNGPAFQVSEGPMRGCVYEPGQIYNVIPPQHAGLFVEVETSEPIATQKKRKNEVTDEHTQSEA